MLLPLFGRMAAFTTQQILHQIAPASHALRSALKLPAGQRPLLRTKKWPPSNRERDNDRQQHAQHHSTDEQNFPELLHSVDQLSCYSAAELFRQPQARNIIRSKRKESNST